MNKIGDIIEYKGKRYVIMSVRQFTYLVVEEGQSIVMMLGNINDCQKVGHVDLFTSNELAEVGGNSVTWESEDIRVIQEHSEDIFDYQLVSNVRSSVEFSERFEVKDNQFRFKQNRVVLDIIECKGKTYTRIKVLKRVWFELMTRGLDITGIRRIGGGGSYGWAGYCHMSSELCTGNFKGVVNSMVEPLAKGLVIENTFMSSNQDDSVGFQIRDTYWGNDAESLNDYVENELEGETLKDINVMHYDIPDFPTNEDVREESRYRGFEEKNAEELMEELKQNGWRL